MYPISLPLPEFNAVRDKQKSSPENAQLGGYIYHCKLLVLESFWKRKRLYDNCLEHYRSVNVTKSMEMNIAMPMITMIMQIWKILNINNLTKYVDNQKNLYALKAATSILNIYGFEEGKGQS